ncbi:MAG TPA: hypothetical protein VNX18_15465 [Bryobacteraceae bacterium]|jgi:Flp pilus assembly pilin Flp|nr:hypothetical protein [Bryobacteraceae bacterium]
MKQLTAFLKQDAGQDLTEYALLLAFVCLASAGIFLVAGSSFVGIWTASNSRLAAGNLVAS